MEQFHSKIENCMKNSLDSAAPTIRFSSVWDQYQKKDAPASRLKRLVAYPLLALMLLTVGFTFAAQRDKTDYPFVNDPSVIGKWQAVDFVDSVDQFTPGQKFWDADLFLNTMVFVKDGKTFMAFNSGNRNLVPSEYTWTKGLVLNKFGKLADTYETRVINGATYMFLQWKDGDYIYFHRTPSYLVLQKTDSQDYADYKPTAREDKIDYPFVDDPQVVGKWETVDFVKTIDKFDPHAVIDTSEMILKQFDIAANGQMSISLTNGKTFTDTTTWTKGLMLDKKSKTASKYEIKELDGESYMFYEFKNGDYIYGGMQPQYFVLKKVK